MPVDLVELEVAVFDCIEANDEFEALSGKQFRAIVENCMGLQEGTLKPHKQNISALINRYLQEKEDATESDKKSGKYSKKESDLILKTCLDHITATGINPSDICHSLREGETATFKRNEIWKVLQDMFPDRKEKSVYRHTNRLLAKHFQEAWTEKDTEMLTELMKTKGTAWAVIGRHMGKLAENCRDRYRIIQKRKKSGAFSADEDNRIKAAVMKQFKMKSHLPDYSDLPLLKISWVAVAAQMNNERQAADYGRHWPTFVLNKRAEVARTKGVLGHPLEHVAYGELNNKNNLTTLQNHLAILQYLKDGGYEDESEVVWAALDRDVLKMQSYSMKYWQSAAKSCPYDLSSFCERLDYMYDKVSVSVSKSIILAAPPPLPLSLPLPTAAGSASAGAAVAGALPKRSLLSLLTSSDHNSHSDEASLRSAVDEEPEDAPAAAAGHNSTATTTAQDSSDQLNSQTSKKRTKEIETEDTHTKHEHKKKHHKR